MSKYIRDGFQTSPALKDYFEYSVHVIIQIWSEVFPDFGLCWIITLWTKTWTISILISSSCAIACLDYRKQWQFIHSTWQKSLRAKTVLWHLRNWWGVIVEESAIFRRVKEGMMTSYGAVMPKIYQFSYSYERAGC